MPEKHAKVTRVRIEASGPTSDQVKDCLIDQAGAIRWKNGGSGWTEDSAPVIQGTKTGYWGYYVIRREANNG